MPGDRVILHVDMDAFFASVEQRDHPELRGRPVLVGGRSNRGVVCAASYEARPYGCRSAMPMAEAIRRCPQAIVVPVRGGVYGAVSKEVFAILGRYSDLVQPLSVDEAFMDVTGCCRLNGFAEGDIACGVELARRIRADILRELHLTASVGVSYCKFLAKLASDLDKPDGLSIVRRDDLHAVLDPLPVGRVWGIGPKAEAKLHKIGVRTIRQLRTLPEQALGGSLGEHVRRLITGQDDRPVHPDRTARSIGCEQTFGQNLQEPDAVTDFLLSQAESVAMRLRAHSMRCRGVTLKLRFGDFTTITRQATLDEPTDLTEPIWQAVLGTFNAWRRGGFRPIRLCGVSLNNLQQHEQLSLFTNAQDTRRRQVDAAVDAIKAKLGKHAIGRGTARSRGRSW